MKQEGEIVGYRFTPYKDGMELYRLIRGKRAEISGEPMGTFTIDQSEALSRFKDKLIHAHPEPLEPKTDWVKYIDGL